MKLPQRLKESPNNHDCSRHFFYKNHVYENVEAQKCPFFKNYFTSLFSLSLLSLKTKFRRSYKKNVCIKTTDRPTDGPTNQQTDRATYRVACTQLKRLLLACVQS